MEDMSAISPATTSTHTSGAREDTWTNPVQDWSYFNFNFTLALSLNHHFTPVMHSDLP